MSKSLASLDFGRKVCSDPALSESREWLVTNGIGGYASGTIAGILTRRYHGLLVAALKPPLGRTLLVTKFDETADYDGYQYDLAANRWASGTIDPMGYVYLERFYLDGAIPVWNYTLADALLEKQIWMENGVNTTYVRYTLRRGTKPLTLSLRALVNYRDYHSTTRDDLPMQVSPVEHGLRIEAYPGATPFYLFSEDVGAIPQHDWYRSYRLAVEAMRGLDDTENHLCAASFTATLQPGQSLTIIASAESTPDLNGEAAHTRRRDYEQGLLLKSRESNGMIVLPQLILAADQFIVRRALPTDPDGQSIIAGYHWFGDWGRDTMISLPGLTLTTGRTDVARRILRTFSHFVDQGMLPNRFPDAGEIPEYNTVDATLWYFEAIRAYYAKTGDLDLVRELFPVLAGIIDWHVRGTRYQIHVDPADGLLFAGEPGVQLTWMDAKIGDWVVTPRIGKPVEINALWYNALRAMADFAAALGEEATPYTAQADKTLSGFDRFWCADLDYCYDVLDTPNGNDSSLRPNQLLAVSLPHSPLSAERQRAVVEACARRLITSHGLRSLTFEHPDYVGRYEGGPAQRDSVYHQGTVWAWLIGPFVSAHLRVYKDPAVAQSFLLPLLHHLRDHGVGSISEIFDGNFPFIARGCCAQAWSVAEVLRAWYETVTAE